MSAAVRTRTTPAPRPRRHVDADDVSAACDEMKRAVEHAGKDEVVDIRLVAERELEALVAKSTRADTTARGWFDVATLREQLDRIEDLHVARAAAKCAEVARASWRVRSGPFFAISAFVRITMPGVQNPHCRAPVDAKTLA